ncbi:MAG TPA: HEPN domain-containing protein [Acidobacteriota bacterium]|nr:HEPN domain-containing protein [Acidobacteriota bacterium]HRV08995.1 HEPN domain-containing protein [Acidobacteriota bacterium]HXK62176.1 HEPN domain-containing protein [Acidobacteriota bacterium]
MELHEEVRQLLLGARKDFRALSGMKDPHTFAKEIFGFHARQAVEKSLKAWITLQGAAYPRTHDISFLLSVLQNLGEDVTAYLNLIDLNTYAVQFRYEAFDDLGGSVDGDSVIRRVGEILDHVQKELDKQDGPPEGI